MSRYHCTYANDKPIRIEYPNGQVRPAWIIGGSSIIRIVGEHGEWDPLYSKVDDHALSSAEFKVEEQVKWEMAWRKAGGKVDEDE